MSSKENQSIAEAFIRNDLSEDEVMRENKIKWEKNDGSYKERRDLTVRQYEVAKRKEYSEKEIELLKKINKKLKKNNAQKKELIKEARIARFIKVGLLILWIVWIGIGIGLLLKNR